MTMHSFDMLTMTKAFSAVVGEQIRSSSWDSATGKGYIDFDVYPEKTTKAVYDDALSMMEDIRVAMEEFDLLVEIDGNVQHDYICFTLTSAIVAVQLDAGDHL